MNEEELKLIDKVRKKGSASGSDVDQLWNIHEKLFGYQKGLCKTCNDTKAMVLSKLASKSEQYRNSPERSRALAKIKEENEKKIKQETENNAHPAVEVKTDPYTKAKEETRQYITGNQTNQTNTKK